MTTRHTRAYTLAILLTLAGCGAGDYERPDHTPTEAKIMCEDFVKRRLKAPGTAKFPAPVQQRHEHLGSGRYLIASHVDAQNAFGVTIRTRYACEIQWLHDTRWRLVALELD